MESNKLQALPAELTALPNLRQVYAAGNDLLRVDQNLQGVLADGTPSKSGKDGPAVAAKQ